MHRRTGCANNRSSAQAKNAVTDTQVFKEDQIDVIAGFRFLKASGDHRSSGDWLVQYDALILGRIERFNLNCNDQIAWRCFDRLGQFAGFGRTRTDAAFSLLCRLDTTDYVLLVGGLVGVQEYGIKAQEDGAKADLDMLLKYGANGIEAVLSDLEGGAI